MNAPISISQVYPKPNVLSSFGLPIPSQWVDSITRSNSALSLLGLPFSSQWIVSFTSSNSALGFLGLPFSSQGTNCFTASALIPNCGPEEHF